MRRKNVFDTAGSALHVKVVFKNIHIGNMKKLIFEYLNKYEKIKSSKNI